MAATGWIAVLAAAVCCAAAQNETVPFKRIDSGGQSGIEERREVVVRTPTEWAALWKEHAPGRPQPAVDFAQSMIVGMFLGYRPTGGHSVEITRVERAGGELIVSYRVRQPDKSDIVTQVITMPFDLVAVDRFDGPVRFAAVQ